MVLDYYHCSEYLHDLIQAQYSKESQKAREWVESVLTRLFLNKMEGVIAGIKCMEISSDAAKEQIEKTLRYLSKHKDHADHGSLKRNGYHILSGGIESSSKFIANVRLKRSGAWWYATNANNILKLRCPKYKGTFEQIIEKFKQGAKASNLHNRKGQIYLIVDNS